MMYNVQTIKKHGRLAERFIATALKAVEVATPPRVQIPGLPPNLMPIWLSGLGAWLQIKFTSVQIWLWAPNSWDIVKLVITRDFDSRILGSNPNVPAKYSSSFRCGHRLCQVKLYAVTVGNWVQIPVATPKRIIFRWRNWLSHHPFKVTLRVRVPSGIPNCYVYELRFVNMNMQVTNYLAYWITGNDWAGVLGCLASNCRWVRFPYSPPNLAAP